MGVPTEVHYNSNHIFMCATCKYKKKGRCTMADSDCYSGIVDDDCSCEEWFPMKGLEVE